MGLNPSLLFAVSSQDMDHDGIRMAYLEVRIFIPGKDKELIEVIDEDSSSKMEVEEEESLEELVSRRKKAKGKRKSEAVSFSGPSGECEEIIIPHVLVLPVKKRKQDQYDEPLDDFVQRRKKKKLETKSKERGKYFQTIVTDYFRFTKVKKEKSSEQKIEEKDILESGQYHFDPSQITQDDDIQVIDVVTPPQAQSSSSDTMSVWPLQPLQLKNIVVPKMEVLETVLEENSLEVSATVKEEPSTKLPYEEHPLAFLGDKSMSFEQLKPRRSLDPFLH